MTQLYEVFINKNYPSSWKSNYKERAHESLGLFLVQYLGNGFNLVDVGQLTYSQYYFDTERKAFRFYRKKTRGRSTGGAEVIIPIIEPLQRILDEIAAPPKLNAYVFPHVLEGATHERDIRKRVSGENSNIQDRVIKICEDVLHWEVRPSGTWARHSFATNLTHAGVGRSYIQESMGHSHLQSVTDRYIANYPLEKQMEYNSKLLNWNPTPAITKKDIKKMSKAEMAALLMELMEK
jgi:integrase